MKSSAANNKEKRSQTFKKCQKQTAQTTQGEEERTDLQNTKCTAELPRPEPAQCTRHTHISEGRGKPRGKKLGIDVAKLVKGDPPPKTQTFVILAEWNWWPGQFPNRDNGHSIHDALGAPLVNCAIPNKKNLKACNLERYFFVWCAVTAWLRGPVWSTG